MTGETVLSLLVAASVLLPAAAAGGFQDYRPIDEPWAEAEAPRIEWRGDWQQTYQLNTERWEKELAAETQDKAERARRLALRQVRLLRAAVERHKPTGEGRIDAYRRIAKHLQELGLDGRANVYRKKLIDEFPGRLDLAAEALYGILENGGGMEGDLWVEYAAERLIALNEAGHLPDNHEAVVAAFRRRLKGHVSRLDLPAGWMDLLAARRRYSPEPLWLRAAEASLLACAGRIARARELFDELQDTEHARRELRGLREYLERHDPQNEAVFPRLLEAETKWDLLAAAHIARHEATADALFASLRQGQSLMVVAPGRRASMWRALTDRLHRDRPTWLAALRTQQEAKAAELLASPARRRDSDAVLAAFRRCPYAPSVHRWLLAAGERRLRAGQVGLARRDFLDVLAFCQDRELRDSARVGLWLALAQCREARGELAAAFRDVPPETLLPWRGGKQRAEVIRQHLSASGNAAPQAAPRALGQAEQTLLELPAAPAWPAGQLYQLPGAATGRLWFLPGHLVGCESGLLVVAPGLLARYDAGQKQPRWLRSPHVLCDWHGGYSPGSDADLAVPAPPRPAIRDGVVYCRWGLDRGRAEPSAVAAFDLETGRMKWSTGGRAFWQELRPASEPAAADGRLYLLAVATDSQVNAPIHLVCLDAADGRALWRRLIAYQTVGIRSSRYGSFRGRRLDLALYGSAVALRGGEVYVSTSAGFVARCDARDGLIEWTGSYRRAASPQKPAQMITRHGPPAVLDERAAIFLPRDVRGAFALDRRTGRTLWENPFLPSDDVVEMPGEQLIFRDAEHVCAADRRTGRIVWMRRFAEGLIGRCAPAGEVVHVATRSAVHRISAATGACLDRVDWRDGELYDFAIGGGRVAGISTSSAGRGVLNEWPAGGKASGKEALRLPLVERRHVPRISATVVLPPPEARAGNRICLASRGLLEVLTTGDSWSIAWRKLIPPGVRRVVWRQDLLVVLHAQAVTAYDAASGTLRWRHASRRPIRRCEFVGPYLAVSQADRPGDIALLEVRTGRLLWHRHLSAGLSARDEPSVSALGRVGKDLFVLVCPASRYTRRKPRYLICRTADGRILRTQPCPEDLHAKWPVVCLTEGKALYFGSDARVHEFRLADGAPLGRFDAVLPVKLAYRQWQIDEIAVFGQWVQVRYHKEDSYGTKKCFILRRGDPAYVLDRPGWGVIRGDRMYEAVKDTLTVVDLPGAKEAGRCKLPDTYREQAEILGFEETPEGLLIAAMAPTDWYRPAKLRVDAFDRQTHEPVAGRFLDVRSWGKIDRYSRSRRLPALQPQLTWLGGEMLLAGPSGLHVFAPAGEQAAARRVLIVQPRPLPVVVDGALDEWDMESSHALAGSPGAGRIAASHDKDKLYLAATCPDGNARPRIGAGTFGGGDFLEVAIETLTGRVRMLVGLDEEARPRVEKLLTGEALDIVDSAVRHDPAKGQTTYELAIPLRSLVYPRGDWRRMRLAAACWDDRGPTGPVAVGRFGAGLARGDAAASRHEPIRLGPMLHRHERAGLDLVARAPDLPESADFLRDYCRIRAEGIGRYETALDRLLKANARSPSALRLLAVLDQALRRRAGDDPTERVLKVAEAAGVPEDVRRTYARMARTYVSQWVYRSSSTRGQMVMLRLHDGQSEQAGWAHRVYWGGERRTYGRWRTPERQQGGATIGPTGQWLELRAPLIWLDMHDKPICGISLIFYGRGYLDRTAIVCDGKEHVLIDDAFPPGKVSGKFEWVTSPVKSGSKALAKTGSYSRDIVQDVMLDRPFTAHLVPGRPKPKPPDAKAVIAALRDNIPGLAGSPRAERFFGALLRLEAGEDEARRAKLRRWFLTVNPETPEVGDILYKLLGYYKAQKGDWLAQMEAVLREAKLPEKTAYKFRLSYLSEGKTFVHSWQVIGPFPLPAPEPGPRATHPIEAGPVDLKKAYPAGEQRVRWRPYTSKDRTIDLAAACSEAEDAFAYAACWVHSDKQQPAFVEIGVDDAGKAWFNRRLILDHKGSSVWARQAQAAVRLRAGWNEILLKITNVKRRWGFCFELVRPDGGGLPEGLRLSAQPPGTPPEK